SPESLANVYVLSPTRGQVPLSAVARYEPTTAPLAVNHQGQFVATTISFNLALGVSLGEAADAVNRTMAEIGVPTTVHCSFQGTARAFRASLDSQPGLILAALVTVYIVLGVLYESYVHPITILSTLPSAGVGELRRPLGIAIVGGLAVSQLLTLYTTPVVYLYLDRFRLWCRRIWAGRAERPSPEAPSGEAQRGSLRSRSPLARSDPITSARKLWFRPRTRRPWGGTPPSLAMRRAAGTGGSSSA